MRNRVLVVFAILASLVMPSRAALNAGTEYFIWLNIYEKLLGSNEAGTGPALSVFGTKTDASSYIFVAEASGQTGYVLLKQKSSGKYLAASSANNWDITLEARSTADRFCWSATAGTYAYLQNKKNTNTYVGIDGAQKGSTYVNVYYDKPKGSHSQMTIIPADGGTYDAARQAFVSNIYTNAQGVKEKDYIQLASKSIDRKDAVDIHLTANEDPITGTTTVNLGSDKTWLIFDNIVPSKVKSDYLKYVRINGSQAVEGTNCRVEIYLNGAAVIPIPQTIFSASGVSSFTLPVGNHTDLGDNNNTMTKFTLRRGYMATLASGRNGGGHSRVYVADHADLTITLPAALAKRVSSVYVRPWKYVSKKGWGNTAGAYGGDDLRATWYWAWNAGYWSTDNMEYVPCRQHRYWPGANEVNEHTSTAAFSLNEPEHSEQHTSAKCSCGGTIDSWTAYGCTSDFKAGGGRIGSPQPTDLSYLTQYFKYVDENNNQTRCDFAVTHAYWGLSGRDATSYANWFCNTQCKSIWNNTNRPVWLTEMEISATWNNDIGDSYSTETSRQYIQALLEKIDECPWIERYAIYSFDHWKNNMYWDQNISKGLTPAGQVYRDHRATFAYNSAYTKEPVWWKPNTKKPSLQAHIDGKSETLTFTITNPNTDWTDKMYVESSDNGTTWKTVTEVDRSLYDDEKITLTNFTLTDATMSAKYRVRVVTLGSETSSSDATEPNYIANGGIIANSKTDIPDWTCQRSAPNGFTKADSGDTYFEVWGASPDGKSFDYYQDITGLKDGVYRLTARVFNSSNNQAGASVNDAVGLYAQTTRAMWFTPVTKDSEIDDADELVIDDIVVTNGNMRIGVRNMKPMTARWAGADDFKLTYLGTTEEVLSTNPATAITAAQQRLFSYLTSPATGTYDFSYLIHGPEGFDTSGWTATKVDVTSGEAYDGQNTDPKNVYFDHWESDSYSSSMSQEIANIPPGKYVLSAILRSATTITMTLTASNGTSEVKKTLTGTAATGGLANKGWQKVELDPIDIKAGETLTIQLSTNGPSWWSADHFQLTYVGEADITATDITDHIGYVLGLSGDGAIDADGNGVITLKDITSLISKYLSTLTK